MDSDEANMNIKEITLSPAFDTATFSPMFDPLGIEPGNQIQGEVQRFDANTTSPYTFIIPTHAPFFASTLVIDKRTNSGGWQAMVLGVDYYLALPFVGASRATRRPVFAAISFANMSIEIMVRMRYQALGGQWSVSSVQRNLIYATLTSNPTGITWEQASNIQTAFPVIDTQWDRRDLTKMQDVILSLKHVEAALAGTAASVSYDQQIAHLTNFSNPHNDLLVDVGLGNVSNFPPANAAQGKDTTNDSTYINPKQVKDLILTNRLIASATLSGFAKLNTGLLAGDDKDDSKALTAGGLIRMAADQNGFLFNLMNKGQRRAVVNPQPVEFPLTWKGQTYANQASFVTAVENYIGVAPLEFQASTGTFWLPPGVNVPSLNTGLLFSVLDPVNAPLA